MERRFSTPLHFKSADVSDEGEFTGLASSWGGPPDAHGDVFERGAYAKSLATRWPVCLWSHDPAAPIGRWAEVVEDAKGLRVRGALNLDLPKAREVRSMLRHNDVGGLSVGIHIPRGGWTRGADGVGVISECALHEISIVSLPANAKAQITSVKSFACRDELVDILRESGLPHRAISKLLADGWRGFDPDDQSEELAQLAERIRSAAALLKGRDP